MPNRTLQAICCLAMLVCCGLTGCSMCCGPYDFHYPTYGGKHQRVDPEYGRVGSVFSDPNATVGIPADSNLDPHPTVDNHRLPLDDDEDDDLEQIKPTDRELDDEFDELPDPRDSSEDSEVTASRTWRQRPLRSQVDWR